eukprot:TRINITY_DN743_c0_g4_i2.p1 TRINITY_DN743_c0_g4~~TRINITY_DN743_c0_g4_i2.p1  ORF type:complete len:587 (+),score=55.16 TRINITY_DN743_c0_g4_i2:3348-5108(+)
MDPLLADFGIGVSPDNTKDFEEVMSRTLDLGNISSETMSSTLHIPDMNECQGDLARDHATGAEKIGANTYFPPPSPVSPDASFLALNFDSKEQTEGGDNLLEQSKGDSGQAYTRVRYSTIPNATGNTVPSPDNLCPDTFAGELSHCKSFGAAGKRGSYDDRNGIILERELSNHVKDNPNRQVYFRAQSQIETPVGDNSGLFPETGSQTNQSTQQLVIQRNVFKDKSPEHGLQALLQLLSESSGPPRKRPKMDHRLRYVVEPELAIHRTNKAVPTPGAVEALGEEISGKNGSEPQYTAVLRPQLPSDAWTDLLQIGDRDDMIYTPPVPEEVPQEVPQWPQATFQFKTGRVMQTTYEDLKPGLSTPLEDAWFLNLNPTTSVIDESIHGLKLPNDPEFGASDEVKNCTKLSDKPKPPCSVVPQPGPHIEILHPNALRDKSPKAVRSLLRATGGDIVSKIDLYWSHFHDFRVSAEQAGRLLREKSVRFERRKRMGPEISAIEKKAIRAQRNRERSQALRRYHKQRMRALEVVSGQLKLNNAVARSLIHCLLEEPRSLELVQEYYSSHECSEELLTYLRGSLQEPIQCEHD